jgi:hypothetical protein
VEIDVLIVVHGDQFAQKVKIPPKEYVATIIGFGFG